MGKISVVLVVVEEELNLLPRALSSVKNLGTDFIIIDTTASGIPEKLVEEYNAQVFSRPRVQVVEQIRNFGILKATSEWILIMDPDEEIPSFLVKKLTDISQNPESADYYRIPRKNIIFGKWMKHAKWWPDYNIRFFRNGKVSWNEVIHSVPMTQGKGEDLSDVDELAIRHEGYVSVEQFLSRMGRYTDAQAKSLIKTKYKLIWKDVIRKPVQEFISRYFAGEGYKDGLHGLALSGLQAFSEFILYLKVWENEKFLEQGITLPEIKEENSRATDEIRWWISDISIKTKDFLSSLPDRIVKKLSSPK